MQLCDNTGVPIRLIDKIQEWTEQDRKFNHTPGGLHLDFAQWSAVPSWSRRAPASKA
jgi:hypothetical protein